MPGLTKDRFRNRTVAFHLSPDEKRIIEARMMMCTGVSRTEYYRNALMSHPINVRFDNFSAERLAVELKHIRESLELYGREKDDEGLLLTVKDCCAVLDELLYRLRGIDDGK
jgi:hypothetical protein